ncbi:hypothetical protein [Myxococcus phage Mx1]|nr:hypothetical protein [Myxococcus phage Mx1]
MPTVAAKDLTTNHLIAGQGVGLKVESVEIKAGTYNPYVEVQTTIGGLPGRLFYRLDDWVEVIPSEASSSYRLTTQFCKNDRRELDREEVEVVADSIDPYVYANSKDAATVVSQVLVSPNGKKQRRRCLGTFFSGAPRWGVWETVQEP